MTSYILYGRDENGKNLIQRGLCIDPDRRYGSFKKKEEKNESLEQVLENPITDQTALKPANERYIYVRKTIPIKRPKYDKKGNLIDIGDSDIPGMADLWESIDRIAHTVAVNEGLVDDPDVEILTPYRLMQLRHQLIDLRRHQYYLRDSYRPTIHPLKLIPPKPQTYTWDENSEYWTSIENWELKVNNSYLSSVSKDIRDYETRIASDGSIQVKWKVRAHTFDWENPHHIKCLINNYSAIAQQLHEKLYADGRYLTMDLDRYTTLIDLSPIYQHVIDRKVDKADPIDVANEIWEKFGVRYSATHIAHLSQTLIPELIATEVRKLHLIWDTPDTLKKRCSRCGQLLPRDPLFFMRHSTHRDHFASACKVCEKKRRIERQEEIMRNAPLPKM